MEEYNKDLLDKFTKTTQERDKIVNNAKSALIEQIPEGGLREITKEMNLAQLTSYIDRLKKNKIIVEKSLNTKPAKKEVNFPKSFRDWENTYLEGK